MASDVSEVTGETYYSGPWTAVQEVLRVLDIGEGKLDRVTQPMVNDYQERTDREIDAIASELYHVPFRAMNQIQPDGVTRRVFPGDLKMVALYWCAGLLLLNEFQGLGQNVTDQATGYIDRARRRLYDFIRPTHHVWGQSRKSNISRTMSPNMQPPSLPEANF